jgi:hypothetical protein
MDSDSARRTIRSIILIFAAVPFFVACISTNDPELPIKSGTYDFQHRDAEFPDSPGYPVIATILGNNIVVTYNGQNSCLSEIRDSNNVLYDETLMWHRKTEQWILGTDDADRDADEVGGCSTGPDIIDFENRILWTGKSHEGQVLPFAYWSVGAIPER